MKLIKSENYKVMPWKNGGGITSEIAIEPSAAQFPKDDFLWRLSSATIEGSNSFSRFEGYDRILFVIDGEGLVLNDSRLLPLTPFYFQGETSIQCELIKNKVIDLGLIYKRGRIKAEASVETYAASEKLKNFPLSEGSHLFFCIQGSFSVQNYSVQAKDCLEVSSNEILEIKASEPCTLIHFVIQTI